MAFHDIDPQAPIHLLIIPKKHIASIMDVKQDESHLLGKIALLAQQLAQENNIDASGFRMVVNTGDEGGQSVAHLHFHLMGGRPFVWPPG